MRLVALLIVAAALVLGLVGAVTAYLPRIDSDAAAERVVGLHLNAPAGVIDGEPIAESGAELTPELIARLRTESEKPVKRVKVREFAAGRWSGWWLFTLGALGLLGAGLFLRRPAPATTPQTPAHAPTTPTSAGEADAVGQPDPAAIIAAIREEVMSILAAVGEVPPGGAFTGASPERSGTAERPTLGSAEAMTPGTAAPAGSPAWAGPGAADPKHAVTSSQSTLSYHRPTLNALIVERIGALQKTQMPAFIDLRPKLISAFGMAGYARLMDAYAAAERQLNRAWSAAADEHEPEAVASLQRALPLLDETARRLPGARS